MASEAMTGVEGDSASASADADSPQKKPEEVETIERVAARVKQLRKCQIELQPRMLLWCVTQKSHHKRSATDTI